MNLQKNDQNLSQEVKQDLTASDSAQIIKSVNPKHPALSRLQAQLKNVSGTSAITSYDRMHHRHNRS